MSKRRGPTRVKHPKLVVARRARNYRAVHRSSRWGNAYSVEKYGRKRSLELYAKWLDGQLKKNPDLLDPLRSYNLGCYCPLDVPCHADIILTRLYGSR